MALEYFVPNFVWTSAATPTAFSYSMDSSRGSKKQKVGKPETEGDSQLDSEIDAVLIDAKNRSIGANNIALNDKIKAFTQYATAHVKQEQFGDEIVILEYNDDTNHLCLQRATLVFNYIDSLSKILREKNRKTHQPSRGFRNRNLPRNHGWVGDRDGGAAASVRLSR